MSPLTEKERREIAIKKLKAQLITSIIVLLLIILTMMTGKPDPKKDPATIELPPKIEVKSW